MNTIDLGSAWISTDDARERGRSLRGAVELGDHTAVTVAPDRLTVEQYLDQTAPERLPELLALRHRRMAADPFAFLRGTAGMMAADLAAGPATGLHGQLCGDAHAANFGLYGTGDGRIVVDINDFDETAVGPWEWDLKRLATSVVLAGCVGEPVGNKAVRKAARDVARAYRSGMARMAAQPFGDAWGSQGDESMVQVAGADGVLDEFRTAAGKAVRNTSARVAENITERHIDCWHFVADPPIVSSLDEATVEAIEAAMPDYLASLRQSRQALLVRYRPRDAAMRIVGTGSVGMRAYILLLQGNGDEPLILQVKQAAASALAPFLPATAVSHEGERIVLGARLVQAETDNLLGWTTVSGRPFIVRQFRNRKGSIDPTRLSKKHLDDFGRLSGALLARAHSRSIDPRILDAYFTDGDEFDDAIATYATGYADQVRADHAELVDAVASGRVEVSAP